MAAPGGLPYGDFPSVVRYPSAPMAIPTLFGCGLGFGLKACFENGEPDGSSGRADGVAVYLKRAAALILAAVMGPELVYGPGVTSWEQRAAVIKAQKIKQSSSDSGAGAGAGDDRCSPSSVPCSPIRRTTTTTTTTMVMPMTDECAGASAPLSMMMPPSLSSSFEMDPKQRDSVLRLSKPRVMDAMNEAAEAVRVVVNPVAQQSSVLRLSQPRAIVAPADVTPIASASAAAPSSSLGLSKPAVPETSTSFTSNGNGHHGAAVVSKTRESVFDLHQKKMNHHQQQEQPLQQQPRHGGGASQIIIPRREESYVTRHSQTQKSASASAASSPVSSSFQRNTCAPTIITMRADSGDGPTASASASSAPSPSGARGIMMMTMTTKPIAIVCAASAAASSSTRSSSSAPPQSITPQNMTSPIRFSSRNIIAANDSQASAMRRFGSTTMRRKAVAPPGNAKQSRAARATVSTVMPSPFPLVGGSININAR